MGSKGVERECDALAWTKRVNAMHAVQKPCKSHHIFCHMSDCHQETRKAQFFLVIDFIAIVMMTDNNNDGRI